METHTIAYPNERDNDVPCTISTGYHQNRNISRDFFGCVTQSYTTHKSHRISHSAFSIDVCALLCISESFQIQQFSSWNRCFVQLQRDTEAHTHTYTKHTQCNRTMCVYVFREHITHAMNVMYGRYQHAVCICLYNKPLCHMLHLQNRQIIWRIT